MTEEKISQLAEIEECLSRYAGQFGIDEVSRDLAVKLATGMLYRDIKNQQQSLRFGLDVLDRLHEYHLEAGYV